MGNIAEFVKETFDAAEAARVEAKNKGQEVEVHFDFSLVSNQRNGIASYAEAHTEVFAEGQLFYSPGHFIGGTKFRFFVPPQFAMRVNSDARYYFSDRRK